jgi:hypothetical protein
MSARGTSTINRNETLWASKPWFGGRLCLSPGTQRCVVREPPQADSTVARPVMERSDQATIRSRERGPG